jgi:chromate transporter
MPVIRWPLLLLAFAQMAMMGFGGVMPFAYRALVERRQWLRADEFAQYLAFSQMLPGPTICNMSIMVGWRFDRLAGAVAAFAGILFVPAVLVIGIGVVYASVATQPTVRHALAGMSAVAAGLVIATALKMALGLAGAGGTRNRLVVAAAFVALAFVGVGLLRWPLILVAGGLAPFAIAAAWPRREARDAR